MTKKYVEFVDFLNSFQEHLNYDDSSNEYDVGYRCASGCVNDATRDYCELFIEYTRNVDDNDLYKEDIINNIVSVLEETLDNKTENNDFNKGYKQKISETIKKLSEYKITKDT